MRLWMNQGSTRRGMCRTEVAVLLVVAAASHIKTEGTAAAVQDVTTDQDVITDDGEGSTARWRWSCVNYTHITFIFEELATDYLKCDKDDKLYNASTGDCPYEVSFAFCLGREVRHPPWENDTTCRQQVVARVPKNVRDKDTVFRVNSSNMLSPSQRNMSLRWPTVAVEHPHSTFLLHFGMFLLPPANLSSSDHSAFQRPTPTLGGRMSVDPDRYEEQCFAGRHYKYTLISQANEYVQRTWPKVDFRRKDPTECSFQTKTGCYTATTRIRAVRRTAPVPECHRVPYDPSATTINSSPERQASRAPPSKHMLPKVVGGGAALLALVSGVVAFLVAMVKSVRFRRAVCRVCCGQGGAARQGQGSGARWWRDCCYCTLSHRHYHRAKGSDRDLRSNHSQSSMSSTEQSPEGTQLQPRPHLVLRGPSFDSETDGLTPPSNHVLEGKFAGLSPLYDSDAAADCGVYTISSRDFQYGRRAGPQRHAMRQQAEDEVAALVKGSSCSYGDDLSPSSAAETIQASQCRRSRCSASGRVSRARPRLVGACVAEDPDDMSADEWVQDQDRQQLLPAATSNGGTDSHRLDRDPGVHMRGGAVAVGADQSSTSGGARCRDGDVDCEERPQKGAEQKSPLVLTAPDVPGQDHGTPRRPALRTRSDGSQTVQSGGVHVAAENGRRPPSTASLLSRRVSFDGVGDDDQQGTDLAARNDPGRRQNHPVLRSVSYDDGMDHGQQARRLGPAGTSTSHQREPGAYRRRHGPVKGTRPQLQMPLELTPQLSPAHGVFPATKQDHCEAEYNAGSPATIDVSQQPTQFYECPAHLQRDTRLQALAEVMEDGQASFPTATEQRLEYDAHPRPHLPGTTRL